MKVQKKFLLNFHQCQFSQVLTLSARDWLTCSQHASRWHARDFGYHDSEHSQSDENSSDSEVSSDSELSSDSDPKDVRAV